MKSKLPEETTDDPAQPVRGVARIGDRRGQFDTRPDAESIIVVDLPDLSLDAAHKIAAHRPVAVLNSASSVTGRGLGLGAKHLVSLGILLVDDLGLDILDVPDGIELDVVGSNVYAGGSLVASGVKRGGTEGRPVGEASRQRLGSRIQSYALSSAQYFEDEEALFLDGAGLPDLRETFNGRFVLVATPTTSGAETIKPLRAFVRDYDPVLVGVGSGADAFAAISKRAEVVVGNPEEIAVGTLQKAAHVVVVDPHNDGKGKDILKRHSIGHHKVSSTLNETDIAFLLADAGGAKAIIDASKPAGLLETFDRSGSEAMGSVLTKVHLGSKLASAQVIKQLYRPKISALLIVALFLAAVLAGAAALFFTPWGESLLNASASNAPSIVQTITGSEVVAANPTAGFC